jgi:hypothetical protein
VVLQGEDGVNIVKDKMAVRPLVQVRDKNQGPGALGAGGVGGATVTFLLAPDAPAKFADDSRSASALTDAAGRAVAPDIRPTGKGSFKIEIGASYQGQTVSRTIAQINFKTAEAAYKAGRIPGWSHGDPGVLRASLGEGGSAGAPAAQDAGTTPDQGGSTNGTATKASAGGHKGIVIAGLVLAGAATAGVVYYEAKLAKKNNSCDVNSIVSEFTNDLTTAENQCSAYSGTSSQCQTAIQTDLNDLGSFCSCAGISGMEQYWEMILNYFGVDNPYVSLPSACQ